MLGPHPPDMGSMVDALETCYCPMCVILPNFVPLDQTVLAYVGGPKKILGDNGAPPPWDWDMAVL